MRRADAMLAGALAAMVPVEASAKAKPLDLWFVGVRDQGILAADLASIKRANGRNYAQVAVYTFAPADAAVPAETLYHFQIWHVYCDARAAGTTGRTMVFGRAGDFLGVAGDIVRPTKWPAGSMGGQVVALACATDPSQVSRHISLTGTPLEVATAMRAQRFSQLGFEQATAATTSSARNVPGSASAGAGVSATAGSGDASGGGSLAGKTLFVHWYTPIPDAQFRFLADGTYLTPPRGATGTVRMPASLRPAKGYWKQVGNRIYLSATPAGLNGSKASYYELPSFAVDRTMRGQTFTPGSGTMFLDYRLSETVPDPEHFPGDRRPGSSAPITHSVATGGAKEFIERIYARYPLDGDARPPIDGRLFTAELARLYADPDVQMDYDPWCSCNDTDGNSKVTVALVSETTVTAIVEATITFKPEDHRIRFVLQKSPAGWRVADIVDRTNGSSSLKTVLRDLAQEGRADRLARKRK